MSATPLRASGYRLLGAGYKDPDSLRRCPPEESSLVDDQVNALHGLLTWASPDAMISAGASKATVQKILTHAREGASYGEVYDVHTSIWTAVVTPPVSSELESLNSDWFVLDEGGKVFVCRFVEDDFPHRQRRRRLVRYRFEDFKRKHETTLVGSGRGQRSIGRAWTEWPGRRQYDRAVFDPSGGPPKPGVLNLWGGWAVAPAPGNWTLIRQHMEKVVCSGNAAHAAYLIKWIATLLQNPSEPGGVVVVLRGKEGAGKSVLGVAIRRILGQHGLMVSDPRHVVGNFNAHLRDLLFLECGEAFFAGDRGQANRLKALITDDMLSIEAKGVDPLAVPNRLHILMTTNESWAVAAGADSRRYFVLDVSDSRLNDKVYWSALWRQVQTDDAIAAMLHDLLHLDLVGFSVREIPVTEGLLNERARSATGVVAWAMDVGDRGEVLGRGGFRLTWREFFVTRDLYEDYISWASRERYERTMSVESFGWTLKNELGLVASECPRAVAASLPEGDRRRKGYWVGSVEAFQERARAACGLAPRAPRVGPEEPHAGESTLAQVSEGSEGSMGSRTEVAPFVPTPPNATQHSLPLSNLSSTLETLGAIGNAVNRASCAPTVSSSTLGALDEESRDALELLDAQDGGFPDADVSAGLRPILATLEQRGLAVLRGSSWLAVRAGGEP